MDDARHRLGRQGADALGALTVAERGQRPIDQARHQRLLHRLHLRIGEQPLQPFLGQGIAQRIDA